MCIFLSNSIKNNVIILLTNVFLEKNYNPEGMHYLELNEYVT